MSRAQGDYDSIRCRLWGVGGREGLPRGPGACPHRGPASEQGRGAGQLHRVPVWPGSVLHNYRDQVKM